MPKTIVDLPINNPNFALFHPQVENTPAHQDDSSGDETTLEGPTKTQTADQRRRSRSSSSERSRSSSPSKSSTKRHSDALLPLDSNMPPKRVNKKLKAAEDKAARLEAQLADLLAKEKRTSSPTEVLKVAAAAKKTSAKKQKRAIKTVPTEDPEEADKLKPYKELISKTIQKEIFPTMKFVKGPGTQMKLCAHILFYGPFDADDMKPWERQAWYERFGGYAAAELNALRSTIMTAIKKEFKAKYVSTPNHDIGSVLRWEACLSRDLSMDIEQDKLDYEFWYRVLMDKATGYPDRWNDAHRGYMAIYQAKPPKHCRLKDPARGDQDRNFYVTPETEAYCMLIIRGNFNKWEAQFLTNTTYPGYQQKIYHKNVDAAKIAASNDIKEELYLAKHLDVTAATLPNGWLAGMRMGWETAENFVSNYVLCAPDIYMFGLILTPFWP